MKKFKLIEELDEQGLFDYVVSHLRTQNKKAVEMVSNVCQYRAEYFGTVTKCAVGCLIGDDEYDKTMEGQLWATMAFSNAISKRHFGLITALQIIHDSHPVHIWEEEFKNTADIFKLTLKPL